MESQDWKCVSVNHEYLISFAGLLSLIFQETLFIQYILVENVLNS